MVHVAGSVDELRFFAVVAASETLTAASRELGCSLPVVSKRLAAMERRLGVHLVHRGTRKLVLTPEGAVLAKGITPILVDVQALEDEITGQSAELRGSLVVESTLGLGRAHIGPLLGEFGALHPRLDVQLTTTPLPLSPHRREFDVAIHVGAPHDSTLRMRRLAENRRVVCASPRYLAEHGRPSSVDELVDHNCIVLRENYSDYALWRFGDGPDEFRMRVDGSLSSNDGDVVTQWAIEGRGLIMRSMWQVASLLAEGSLVRVLEDVPTPGADVYALHADVHHVPVRITAVIDYLAEELPRRLGRVSLRER
ncbi:MULTISPECIES: LysR family transcriptional regulator [Actinomadura]|uniref:DNA-binding transcriptional regulator, LysR family n=1 Tax=Actinomadura madurae TaxID=1993 RepID=A0A1I5J2Y3_9ACTN|nr:LysR family transcriptional regulator [Actinomadura madurae]SFO67224.1 DNA-binding transcriptional regulator, LysR family [Actinomadura madurae]SPT58624.1 D-malate degradation protein R [Actinomadura madurae]